MAVDAMKHRPLDVHYRQAVCVVRGARNRVEPTEEVVVERRGLAARVRVDPREVACQCTRRDGDALSTYLLLFEAEGGLGLMRAVR